jgi:DNA-binding NarL/FixJ family response regulator
MRVNKIYSVVVIDEVLVSHTGLSALINDLQDFKAVDQENYYDSEQANSRELDALLFSTRSIDNDVIHKLKKIKTKWNGLPIVVLAPGISRAEQFALICLDINGLIIQEATRKYLKESLLCAVHNGQYYPEAIMAGIKEISRRPVNGHLVKAAFSDLQKRILQLLASGLTTPMVAEKLFKSTRTIEWHKEKMMKITRVASTSQLLLFALEYGIIESPFDIGGQVHPRSEVREETQRYL